jgi:hypothetical protein
MVRNQRTDVIIPHLTLASFHHSHHENNLSEYLSSGSFKEGKVNPQENEEQSRNDEIVEKVEILFGYPFSLHSTYKTDQEKDEYDIKTPAPRRLHTDAFFISSKLKSF